MEVMKYLSAGKWQRKISSGGSEFIDYETEINGVRVLLYNAAPLGSCRVIEETIEVPAKTITVRKLICAN